MNQPTQNLVAGAGLAELPIPFWIRAARATLAGGAFAIVVLGAFAARGWDWVTKAGAEGLSPEFALWCATIVTMATAVVVALFKTRTLNKLLSIRQSHAGRWVFGGFRRPLQPALACLAALSVVAGSFTLLQYLAKTNPLPDKLSNRRQEVIPPNKTAGLHPVYFWDYATWIDPKWLDEVNLVLPYEKGIPRRLLPKIIFENAATHQVALELHGKRPRQYGRDEVDELFQGSLVHPRDWPLVWRLEREAGLTTEGLAVPELSLLTLAQAGHASETQAIGVPWQAEGAQTPRPEAGRAFFWGPDGSVFQFKCPSPCSAARVLELVEFPGDPRGSAKSRLEWTKNTLKGMFANPTEKRRFESLLTIYLVSLLTLDPRDPEVFFHLGKLARNRETALSALRYGKDVGMDRAQLIELEGVIERLTQ